MKEIPYTVLVINPLDSHVENFKFMRHQALDLELDKSNILHMELKHA